MRLSCHFTLEEFTKSQTALRRGIKNQPGAFEVLNMKRLAAGILEPVRAAFDRPFSPTSGFRSAALNVAIGSRSTSQHIKGEAVDFEIAGVSNLIIAKWIHDHLKYDQLILEFHDPKKPAIGWVHVSLKENDNRRQALTINSDGVKRGLG